jgi:hypothetical protein
MSVVVLYLVLGFVFVSSDECGGGGKCENNPEHEQGLRGFRTRK